MRPSAGSRIARIARIEWIAAAAIACAPCVAPPAAACGHCREDKIAAAYDYGVLTRAARAGHVVVFTEIHGPAAGAGSGLQAFIERTLAARPGVDAGTVRVSLDPPAASFAWDPARGAPGSGIAGMNSGLAAKRLRLSVLEVDRGPLPRAGR
jgi:hypothetical protein